MSTQDTMWLMYLSSRVVVDVRTGHKLMGAIGAEMTHNKYYLCFEHIGYQNNMQKELPSREERIEKVLDLTWSAIMKMARSRWPLESTLGAAPLVENWWPISSHYIVVTRNHEVLLQMFNALPTS